MKVNQSKPVTGGVCKTSGSADVGGRKRVNRAEGKKCVSDQIYRHMILWDQIVNGKPFRWKFRWLGWQNNGVGVTKKNWRERVM